MESVVVWDLDGVLADSRHREHLIPTDREVWSNWDAWASGIPDDSPIMSNIVLAGILQRSFYTYIFTSRGDDYRRHTEAWLARYGVFYDQLIMREVEDTRPSQVVKAEWYRNVILGRDQQVLIAFDDEQPNVDMWKSEGVPCHLFRL